MGRKLPRKVFFGFSQVQQMFAIFGSRPSFLYFARDVNICLDFLFIKKIYVGKINIPPPTRREKITWWYKHSVSHKEKKSQSMMVLTLLSSSLLSSLPSLTGPPPSNSRVYFSSPLPSPRRRLNPKPNHRNRHLSLPLLSRTSPTRSIHCSSSFSSMPLEVSTSPSQVLLFNQWVNSFLVALNHDYD